MSCLANDRLGRGNQVGILREVRPHVAGLRHRGVRLRGDDFTNGAAPYTLVLPTGITLAQVTTAIAAV